MIPSFGNPTQDKLQSKSYDTVHAPTMIRLPVERFVLLFVLNYFTFQVNRVYHRLIPSRMDRELELSCCLMILLLLSYCLSLNVRA
mmetsp:Transcript_7983/g.12672  ORF Transcript_7983/g.12672 Transcript_7983/m.12672 type:complete len:86 (-) Transcript_7983:1426-1683(-)